MSIKTRIVTMLFALLIVCALLLSLFSYCQGKKVGVATTNSAQVTKEVSLLEDEKDDIQRQVHALDTDALHHRILDLSQRCHKQAALIKPAR